MFKIDLKYFYRRLKGNKLYTIFSIVSLSFGILCCIFIYQYVNHELSYEQFIDNAKSIVRLEVSTKLNSDQETEYATLPSYYIPSQLNSVPEVVAHTRMATLSDLFFETESAKKISQKNGFAADSSFFEVFGLEIINGNTSSPLSKPNSIVLTKKIAAKYFPNEPVGKSIRVSYGEKSVTLLVTAVINNIPANSHLKLDYLIDAKSSETLFNTKISDAYVAYEYLLLSNQRNLRATQKKLSKYKPSLNTESNFSFSYNLQPISKIHLYSSKSEEIKTNGDIRYIYFLVSIGLIIIVISCINFVSLTLSLYSNREKEIGLKKMLGASQIRFYGNAIFESTILTTFSLIIACILCLLLLPFFNSFTENSFLIQEVFSPINLMIYLGTSIIIGIICGTYFGIDITRKRVSSITGGHSISSSRSKRLQKTILVIQFAASIALVICTITVFNQFKLIFDKDLGFDRDRIIVTDNLLGKDLSTFRKKISDYSFVQNFSVSSYIPGISQTSGTGPIKVLSTNNEITANWISVDYNFFDTYGIEVVKGRAFSKKFSADSLNAFLINKEALTDMGIKEPLGKRVQAFGRTGEIIGVVKNFNLLSLHNAIPSMFFMINKDYYFSLSIKLKENADLQYALNQIEGLWYSISPNTPFNYGFVEQEMDALYKSEQNAKDYFILFTIVVIILSCFGLFSITAYSVQKRKNEIGIRKVLGGTSYDILKLFFIDYFRLIVIASLIAFPISYLFLSNWLESYAYKTDISIVIFLSSFLLITALSMLTISYWTIKAAFRNPVKSIKR